MKDEFCDSLTSPTPLFRNARFFEFYGPSYAALATPDWFEAAFDAAAAFGFAPAPVGLLLPAGLLLAPYANLFG